jgi:hypothetical protein
VLLLVEMVSAELLTPSLVMLAGVKVALAPVGRPDALSLTVWALPLTSGAVIVDDPDTPPCTALTKLGDADTEKSPVTGGAAALNRAMPAAQYIEVPNVPARLCALVEVSGCEAAMTDTMLGELVVCCGSTL